MSTAPETTAVPLLTAPTPAPAPPPIAASDAARRLAGLFLEVLAGARSITDAALALGVTTARYHALEARALQGLVSACEPPEQATPTGSALRLELERLRAERDRLRSDAARYQALARLAHQAYGSDADAAAAAAMTRSATGSATTKRPRQAMVRALRVADRVRTTATAAATAAALSAATRAAVRAAKRSATATAANTDGVRMTAAPDSPPAPSTTAPPIATPARDRSGG